MSMRNRQVGWVLGAFVAGGLVIAGCWPFDFAADPVLIGQLCDDGTLDCFGTTSTGSTASTTTIDPECIPAEASDAVDDDCGVFVSSTMGQDTNSGTAKDQPFKTIEKALAEADGRPIYLCGEAFLEAVELQGSVRIYGALDCTDGWKYLTEKRSSITPAADLIPVRVAPNASVELSDVDLIAADAAVPGGSSIALLAESDADVRLSRCDIEAKAGAEGESPAPTGTGTPGPGGENGEDGCKAMANLGGLGGVNLCAMETFNASGGVGGVGLTPGDGGDGSAGKAGSSPGGAPGTGQVEVPPTECTAGGDGAAGVAGQPGDGAPDTALGTLDATGFAGASGSAGKTAGTPGAGGGGGGGAMFCTTGGGAGPGGGGGGAGGCGGAPGQGGRGGGASIGIVSLGATFTFLDVTITAGAGGKGGDGGPGQPGGKGGDGGMPGAVSMIEDVTKACAGGKGGDGGPGGRGGGGRGGPSIGIAHAGVAPDTDGATIEIGAPGEGGEGEGETGKGALGAAASTLEFPI